MIYDIAGDTLDILSLYLATSDLNKPFGFWRGLRVWNWAGLAVEAMEKWLELLWISLHCSCLCIFLCYRQNSENYFYLHIHLLVRETFVHRNAFSYFWAIFHHNITSESFSANDKRGLSLTGWLRQSAHIHSGPLSWLLSNGGAAYRVNLWFSKRASEEYLHAEPCLTRKAAWAQTYLFFL